MSSVGGRLNERDVRSISDEVTSLDSKLLFGEHSCVLIP